MQYTAVVYSTAVVLVASCLLTFIDPKRSFPLPGLRLFSRPRVGYLEFSELTGFAGWWVGDSVSSRFARMQVSDFAVGGGWWVQDHGWLAGWLDAPARAHARMHPSSQPRARMHNWADSRCTQIRSCTAVCMRSLRLSQ